MLYSNFDRLSEAYKCDTLSGEDIVIIKNFFSESACNDVVIETHDLMRKLPYRKEKDEASKSFLEWSERSNKFSTSLLLSVLQ